MEREKAIEFAQIHIDELNRDSPLHPEYLWIVSQPEEYSHVWYFNYEYKPIQDIAEEDWLQFGGAPGFAISKHNGQIRTISWGELSSLGEKE